MVIIPFFANIGGSTGFYLCDIMLVINGVAFGVVQATYYGMAGPFPPQYMGAVMFGNGIAGFGSNILRGCTLLIWPDDDSSDNAFKGTLALYLFTTGLLICCCIAQTFLSKNEFANFYLKKLSSPTVLLDTEDDEQLPVLNASSNTV